MIYRVVCELREFLQLPRVSLYRLSHHLEDRVISVTMIFHLLQNSHVLMEQNWADIAEISQPNPSPCVYGLPCTLLRLDRIELLLIFKYIGPSKLNLRQDIVALLLKGVCEVKLM